MIPKFSFQNEIKYGFSMRIFSYIKHFDMEHKKNTESENLSSVNYFLFWFRNHDKVPKFQTFMNYSSPILYKKEKKV